MKIRAGAALACLALPLAAGEKVAERLSQNVQNATLTAEEFRALGWNLPDQGRHVKALADATPGGAFDPRALEKLKTDQLGYKAKFHVVRYSRYAFDWDITGLELQPQRPAPGLPTIVIIHGGSANWYEFFLDPLNGPGLGQYLAQKVPVLLVTIPGNYKDGGWTEKQPYDERIPGYVLDAKLSAAEASKRNAAFTFALVMDGLQRLIEKTTRGPLLVIGHSTGGELPFLLQTTMSDRPAGRFLGWGTGGPAHVRRDWENGNGRRARRVENMGRYPNVSRLRPRDAEGYVASDYVGPLNPLAGGSPRDTATRWFERESVRRPQFKQVLQDMEHGGMIEHKQRLEQEIREALPNTPAANAVVKDLFLTNTAPLKDYQRMVWVVGRLDEGHGGADTEQSLDVYVARRFQAENPKAEIRVLTIDAPLTHYGHIERPRELAGTLFSAATWLSRP